MPGQILIAFVAEFRLYGFWGGDGLFAELLRILEKDGATELATRQALPVGAWWFDGIGGVDRSGMGTGRYFRVGGDGVFVLVCWAWYWLSRRSRRVTAEGKS